MAGNLMERVADWYGADYYCSSPAVDPRGPETGQTRAIRGGSLPKPLLELLREPERRHRLPVVARP